MPISRITTLGLTFFTLSWLAYDHYRPWVNFHAELLAFIGLFGLIAGVLRAQRQALAMPRLGIWLSLVVLLPWLQFASGLTFFAGDALLSSLYLFGLLAAMVVGYTFARSGQGQAANGLTALMHTLWVAAMVSGAIGLAQWLNIDDRLGMVVVQSDLGDRAMGNLGQANQLATLLLMGMAAYAYVFERRVIGRLAFAMGIGFMTSVLILTQSRAGMLSVLVVTAYAMWKKKSVQSRLSGQALVLWVLLFALGTLLLSPLSEYLQHGNVRNLRETDTIHQRVIMLQQMAHAIAQAPWLGYGWNQTPSAQAAGAIAYPGSVPYTYAHNFAMDMLAWNGLPLGLLLTGAIAYWFVTRLLASRRPDAIHAMACLLPVAVHSLLEYPFAYAYFLISAGLMVGVIEAARIPVTAIALNVRWVWAMWAAWALTGIYLTYEYFLIEEDFRVVRFENLNIGQRPAAYEIPDVWMMSHMSAMLKARRVAIEPHMQAGDLENLRQVSTRFADNVPHCRYALALALNNNTQGAEHEFALIKGIYGSAYQRLCQSELRRLQKEKSPQFASPMTP